MPPGEYASFRLRIDAGGHGQVTGGEDALRALCEDDRTYARFVSAVVDAVDPASPRRDLEVPTGGPRPIFVSLAIRPAGDGGTLVEGRAIRPRQPAEAGPVRLREIEAFAALWAHVESTPRESGREIAVLGQLTTLPEVAAARLHRGPARGPAARSALAERRTVVEPVLPDHARPADPLQLRLWLPLGSGAPTSALLEIVLEAGVVPDGWQMELFEGYADLLALSAALDGDGPGDPRPAPGCGPVRSSGLPAPHALTPRQRDLVYLLATGVDGTRELASRLGVAAPTVKAHLRTLMRRLGVGSRLELVRIALEQWGDWLAEERLRRGDAP